MAELYRTTYRMDRRLKCLYELENGCCSKLPSTLDDPRHYAYDPWEKIAEDFDPEDMSAWNRIARQLNTFPGMIINNFRFVNPMDKKHPHPKHPVGKTCITVYWLRETDELGHTRTLPIEQAREAWDAKWNAHWKELEQTRAESVRYKDMLRHPKTSKIGRQNLTEQELREIKDEYGITLKNQPIETDVYDDRIVSRYRAKSWKDTSGKEHAYDKNWKRRGKKYGIVKPPENKNDSKRFNNTPL